MHEHWARPGFERARAYLRGLLAALAAELRDLALAVLAPGRKVLHALLHLARQQHLRKQANAVPSAHAGCHWAEQAVLQLNEGIWTFRGPSGHPPQGKSVGF